MRRKVCTSCGLSKPATTEYFYRHTHCVGGLNTCCIKCHNAKGEEWYRCNRVYRLSGTRAWYRANRKRKYEQHVRWKRANPEYSLRIRKAADCNTRARRAGIDGFVSPDDILKVITQQKGNCLYCRNPLTSRYNIDHKVPLVRGGANRRSNLACACPSCDRRKHTQTKDEYMALLRAA